MALHQNPTFLDFNRVQEKVNSFVYLVYYSLQLAADSRIIMYAHSLFRTIKLNKTNSLIIQAGSGTASGAGMKKELSGEIKQNPGHKLKLNKYIK